LAPRNRFAGLSSPDDESKERALASLNSRDFDVLHAQQFGGQVPDPDDEQSPWPHDVDPIGMLATVNNGLRLTEDQQEHAARFRDWKNKLMLELTVYDRAFGPVTDDSLFLDQAVIDAVRMENNNFETPPMVMDMAGSLAPEDFKVPREEIEAKLREAGVSAEGVKQPFHVLANIRFRQRKIQNMFRILDDKDLTRERFEQTSTLLRQQIEKDPEVEGGFLSRMLQGSVRDTLGGLLGSQKLSEKLGTTIPPDGRASLSLQALGILPWPTELSDEKDEDGNPIPSVDLVDAFYIAEMRERYIKDHPTFVNWIDSGLKWEDEHGFLANMGAEILTWLPIAVLESPAAVAGAAWGTKVAASVTRGTLGGVKTKIGANLVVNASLNASEAFIITPTESVKERMIAAGIAGAAAGVFEGGLKGLKKGATLGAEKVGVDRDMARTQLAKLLRGIPGLASEKSGADGLRIVDAVRTGVIDGATLTQKARDGWTDQKIAAFVDEIMKGAERDLEADFERGDVPALFGDHGVGFKARARAESLAERDRLWARYSVGGASKEEGRRMALELVDRYGVDFEDPVILGLGRGSDSPDFYRGMEKYVETVGNATANDIRRKFAAVRREYPGIPDEDLDYFAHKLFQFELQFRLRGVDAGVDLRVLDEVPVIADIMRRAHGGAEPSNKIPKAGGRVAVEVEGGKTKIKPLVAEGGQDLGTVAEHARPAIRVAMDLFASASPGFHAMEGHHELTHVFLHSMSVLNPSKYDRLAQEIVDIYSKNMPNTEMPNVKDPVVVAELFARLMSNHTLSVDTFRGGNTFIEVVERKFRDVATQMINTVKQWRERYWHIEGRDGKSTGPMADQIKEGHSFPKMWSDELTEVADKFARGDWAEVADELAATRRSVDGQGSTPGTTPQFFHEALPKGEGKPLGAGRPKKRTTLVNFKGLENVPVRDDVSPPLLRSAGGIDYGRVARAILSDALVDQKVGDPVPAWQRIRELASWYESSNKAGPYIKARLTELALKHDPANVAKYQSLSTRRIMNLLGALGANRSPDQNLRLAIQGVAYQTKIPGGFDARTMQGDEGPRMWAVNSLGEFALAPARDVLRILATGGQKNAQKMLAKGADHRDYPKEGESYVDWIDREPVGMSDAMKLPAYNLALTLDDGGTKIANDVWQQRFFLQNDPEKLQAIYALSDGDTPRFSELHAKSRALSQANQQAAREIDTKVKALKAEGKQEMSAGAREDLNREIEALLAKQASYGEKGSRIAKTNSEGFRPYKIKAADYRMMDNLQLSLAEFLNRHDPRGDNFWDGKRVQAAIWGLMRGEALSDSRAIQDFLSVATKEFETEGGRFEKWFKSAVANATEDQVNLPVRSSFAINTPFGRNEFNNKLLRNLTARRASQGGKKGPFGVNEEAAMVADLNTVNGQAPLRLAKSIGASGMRHRPATGMFLGDVERTAEIEFQADSGQTRTIGHFISALNRQRAWEGASLREDLTSLPKSPEDFADANGVVVVYKNAGTQEAAESAFRKFVGAMSRATGKEVKSIVEGGTTTVRGGHGMTRITAGRMEDGTPFGILDEDSFLRYLFDAEEAANGEVGLWKGESWYEDVFDELDELGPGEWGDAWRGASGPIRGSEARDMDALPYGAGEAADIVSARHLFHALKGIPESARRDVARDYLVQTRARLRLATALARDYADAARTHKSQVNSLEKRIDRAKKQSTKDRLRSDLEKLRLKDPAIEQADSAITPGDLKAFQPTANGSVLRMLSRLEPEVLSPTVAREVIASAKSLKKVAFRALDTPDRQLLQVQQRAAVKAGVAEKHVPKEFHDVLDPRDAAKSASSKAQQSADSFRASGDEATARVRDQTVRNAEDAARTAENVDSHASPVEISLIQRMVNADYKPLAREALSNLRHGMRWLWRDRFETVNEVDAEVGNMFNVALSSGIEAKQLVDQFVRAVTKNLDDVELDLFERFLQTEKANVAIKRAAEDRREVSPYLLGLMLTPVEMSQVKGNKNIQEAIRLHKETVQPEVERILLGIDPENAGRLMQTESGAFISSLRYNPEFHGPNVRTTQSFPGAGTSLPGKFNVPENSASMKTFKGTAERYVTDYGEVMLWKFTRENALYRQKQLVNLMVEKGLLIPKLHNEPRPTKKVGKTDQPWEPIQVRRAPQWIKRADADDLEHISHDLGDHTQSFTEYWAPAPIRKAWEDMRQGGARVIQFGQAKPGFKLLGSEKIPNAWFKFADLTTAATLATVAEATRHSMRILALAASIPAPPVRTSTGKLMPDIKDARARLLLPWIGIRARRLNQMAQAYNTPEAKHLARWAGVAGGLPNRMFEETRLSGITPAKGATATAIVGAGIGGSVGGLPGAGIGAAIGAGLGVTRAVRHKIPELVHRGREFLFSIPDAEARTFAQMWKDGDLIQKRRLGGKKVGIDVPVLGNFRSGPLGVPVPKTLWGFDVRARVVATKIFLENLKITGRVPEDVDVSRLHEDRRFDKELREFLNAFGQFNNRIQTKMVEVLRTTRLQPFAASQGGTRPAEIERVFGVSRLPTQGLSPAMRGWYHLQTIQGGWLGYMVALAVVNKALSGHWNWENQEGRELDLDIGVKDLDDSPQYIQGNFLQPTTARSFRTLGVRTMIDERAGRTLGERALSVASPTLMNEVLQMGVGGPAPQIAQILAEGKLRTFKSTSGDDLRISPPAHGAGGEVINRLSAALASMNSNIGQFMAEELATKRHAQDPRLRWAFEVPQVLFGHIGRQGRPPTIEAGNLSRIERRKRSDLAWYTVQRYTSATDPAKKNEIFGEYMKGFKSQRERMLAKRDFFQILRSTKKSPTRRALESRRIREERAQQ
jgi:hypothetical protein